MVAVIFDLGKRDRSEELLLGLADLAQAVIGEPGIADIGRIHVLIGRLHPAQTVLGVVLLDIDAIGGGDLPVDFIYLYFGQ